MSSRQPYSARCAARRHAHAYASGKNAHVNRKEEEARRARYGAPQATRQVRAMPFSSEAARAFCVAAARVTSIARRAARCRLPPSPSFSLFSFCHVSRRSFLFFFFFSFVVLSFCLFQFCPVPQKHSYAIPHLPSLFRLIHQQTAVRR